MEGRYHVTVGIITNEIGRSLLRYYVGSGLTYLFMMFFGDGKKFAKCWTKGIVLQHLYT